MIFFRKYVCSKPQTVGSLCRIKLVVIQTKTIFGVQLLDQLRELLLISDVYKHDHITGIQRNISTVAALKKQISRNQNHADISMKAAYRKQVTHLLRIDVVEIVYDHEACFATTTTIKIPRYAFVILSV